MLSPPSLSWYPQFLLGRPCLALATTAVKRLSSGSLPLSPLQASLASEPLLAANSPPKMTAFAASHLLALGAFSSLIARRLCHSPNTKLTQQGNVQAESVNKRLCSYDVTLLPNRASHICLL